MNKISDTEFTGKGALYPFLKRLTKYSFRYPGWVAGFTFFVLLVALAEAVYPLVWLSLIDNVMVPYTESLKTLAQPKTDYEMLLTHGIIFLTLGLILSAGVYFFIRYAGRIQEYVMFDIRQQIFIKLQELSFSFYDKSVTGWLLSRISSDAVKVTELISWSMIEAIWGFGMIIFCVTAMFIYNWKLALIVTSVIPLLAIVSFKLRILILKYSRESRKLNSEITAFFNEHINGIEVNKSLVQEKRVSAEFTKLSERMRISSYKAAFYQSVFMPVVIFGGSTAAAFVIYYGGIMATFTVPEITVGTLAAFFGYATMIFEPILDISRFYSQAQNSISAGERIFSLIDKVPAIQDSPEAVDFGKINGDIEFRNVSFSYTNGKPVLKNLNLNIKAGTSVALVGETGGGKSTIVNLICRFYEPDDGCILIDGIDYRTRTTVSLRRQIGVVLQTPHLFSGTVRENILYGKTDATETEVIKSLLSVTGEELISKLDEDVGEGGEKLSTGQKQIISFARALISDPRIFIMDEATSSVDTLTEEKIQLGIKNLMYNRTAIIIAHRLSTIRNCDRILVIENGEVIEDGCHEILISRKGLYYKLYTRQLIEEMKELIIKD